MSSIISYVRVCFTLGMLLFKILICWTADRLIMCVVCLDILIWSLYLLVLFWWLVCQCKLVFFHYIFYAIALLGTSLSVIVYIFYFNNLSRFINWEKACLVFISRRAFWMWWSYESTVKLNTLGIQWQSNITLPLKRHFSDAILDYCLCQHRSLVILRPVLLLTAYVGHIFTKIGFQCLRSNLPHRNWTHNITISLPTHILWCTFEICMLHWTSF